MAIERVRRVGVYAPLAANYFMDDAIAEAGEAAELLYLRALAFCASRPEQDGYVSRTQLMRFVGVGMGDVLERAGRLVEVELWEAVDDGYQVRSWLKWNRSADEIGRYRAKDRERKRKAAEEAPDGRADSETPSERNPRGVRQERVADSETPSDTQMHFTTDAHQEEPSSSASMRHLESTSPRRPKPGSDDDPDWVKFWSTYPKKVSKATARKRWAAAVKKTDPAVIIAGAERYRDLVIAEKRTKGFIKDPDGWLSGEKWTDDMAATTSPGGTIGHWWDN